jgi:hypothetical protein
VHRYRRCTASGKRSEVPAKIRTRRNREMAQIARRIFGLQLFKQAAEQGEE